MKINIPIKQIFMENSYAGKRYLYFEFLSCASSISSKCVEKNLKDFESLFRN